MALKRGPALNPVPEGIHAGTCVSTQPVVRIKRYRNE